MTLQCSKQGTAVTHATSLYKMLKATLESDRASVQSQLPNTIYSQSAHRTEVSTRAHQLGSPRTYLFASKETATMTRHTIDSNHANTSLSDWNLKLDDKQISSATTSPGSPATSTLDLNTILGNVNGKFE